MAESTSSLRSGGRLLIAEFDSPAQARSFDDRDPAVALRELTQRLRVGMIVAESVVVTDAMVLDGAYFLALGPSGVLRDLGLSTVQLPLLITGRAISLAQALEDRRADPEHLWASAGFVPSRRWHPPESVIRVWDEWIDAEERGLLRYEQQEISSSTVMRFGDLPTLSASGKACAARLRRTVKRSVAENMLRLSVLTHEERAVLRDWWSDAYMRLIAENARADWLSFRGSHASRPEERQGAVMLALPERLKTWAEMATPAAVAEARGCTTALRKRLVEASASVFCAITRLCRHGPSASATPQKRCHRFFGARARRGDPDCLRSSVPTLAGFRWALRMDRLRDRCGHHDSIWCDARHRIAHGA